jgi:L-threonylcarbamoyladenylate synthase
VIILIIQVDALNPEEEIIEKAVHILQIGGLLVYPTETAYGLGCDAYNVDAIARIFKAKSRPLNQPLSVIVNNMAMIEEIAVMQEQAKILIEKYHPGPLVISLKKKKVIPDILNQNQIAFRISSSKLVQKIIEAFGKPIVSTSANKSGCDSPYSIVDVLETINEKDVNLILDAGPQERIKTSTLIDFVQQPSPQIIREGAILASEILTTLNIKEELWEQHFKNKNL